MDAGALIFRIQMAGAAVFAKDAAAAKTAQEALGRSADEAAGKETKLGTEVDKTGAAANKAKAPLDGASTSTKKMGDEAGKASPKAKTLGSELKGMSEEAQAASREIGGAAFGIGAAVGAMVVLTAKSAIDWQTAWTGVTKTVEGTPAELNAVEAGLRGLAKELPASATEIAAVAEAAGQLGIQTGSVVSFTKTMIDLGETTNLSAGEAATSLARFMNVMGTSQDKVSNLGSSIVELGNNYATTEAEILAMATRLSGASRQVGLSEGETLGLAAALSSVGIEAEAGGSAVSKVMIDIAASVDKGGERLDKFATIAGVGADTFAKKWKTDPGAALALFVKGLADAEAQGGSTLSMLEDLGITEVRMRDALLRSAAASDQFTAAMNTGNTAFEENNALLTEAEKRYETVASKIQIAGNNVNDAAIDFGEVFLPAIVAVTEGVVGFSGAMADLPGPVKDSIAVLGAAAGGVALLSGVLLLGVPQIITYRAAIVTLRTQLPGVALGFGKVASTAGALTTVALAAWLAHTLGGFIDTAREAAGLQENVDSLTKSLDAVGVQKTVDLVAGEGLNDIAALTNNGFWSDLTKGTQQAIGGVSDFMLVFKVLGVESKLVTNQLTTVDKTMAALVASGKTKEAAELYKELASRTDGSEEAINKLNLLLPEYAALQGGATEKTEEAAAATELLVAAEEAAIQKTEEWLGMIAGANADFIDFNDGLDSVIQKNQETAQATADATDDSGDSWETYYDGFSFQLADYLTELQTMVDAQNNWESNMVVLAGKVSDGVLDELARMGPEGAPLVAALVTASDEELAQAEALFAERADAATGAFATRLQEAQAVVAVVAAKYGRTAADEVARELSNGTTTVQQVMEKYRIAVEGVSPTVNVNTSVALSKIQTLMNVLRNLPSATVPVGTGTVLKEANGGVVDYYANGGVTENHVAQIARAGSYRVWAEPETGGEAYIPLSPAKRARSLAIWEETGRRLGVQGFSDGGFHGGDHPPGRGPAMSDRPLIGSLTLQSSGSVRDDLEETLFHVRRIARGGLHG